MHLDDALLVRQRSLLLSFGPLPGVGPLTYRSDRVPGRHAAWRLPLEPRDAGGVITIAGREEQVPAADLPAAWTWDGCDGDGRVVGTSAPLQLRRRDGSVRRTVLGRVDVRRLGLGGWSPGMVHQLDVAAKHVHFGVGSVRTRVAVQDVRHEGQEALAVAAGRRRLVFDLRGRHLATLMATGAAELRLQWDGDALVAWSTSSGLTTEVVRRAAADGSVTVVVQAGARETALDLDAAGWCRTIRSPAGREFAVDSDSGGLIGRLVRPGGGELLVEYDDGYVTARRRPGEGWHRLVATTEGATARVTSLSAEGRETNHHATREPDGTVVHATRCCGRSQPTRVERRAGTTTTHLPNGAVSVRRPMEGGEQQVLTLPSGTTLRVERTYERAEDGRERRRTIIGDAEHATVTSANGRELAMTTPEGRTARISLDERGRPSRIAVPGQPTVEVVYDAGGPIRVRHGGHELTYAGEGTRADVVTDPERGLDTRLEHDADDLLVAAHLPGDRVVRFELDDDGAVVSLSPPGRPAHRFGRDDAGRIHSEQPPAVDGAVDELRRAFDDDGLLVRVDRPGGIVRHLERDAAGRVERIRVLHEGGDEEVVVHERDVTSGLLVRTRAGDLVTEHAWDGPLPVGERMRGPLTATLLRGYDDSGAVVEEAVKGDAAVTFVRDRDGLVVAAGALELVREPATGHVVERRFGVVTERIGRRQDGLPTTRTVHAAGDEIARVVYEWDARGRLLRVECMVAGTTTLREYTYDEADRLATVRENGATVLDHQWDANGARRALHRDDPAPVTVDERDRPTAHGGARIAHLPHGARATRTEADGRTTTYLHDDVGRLRGLSMSAGEVRHQLDAFGRRVLTTVDGRFSRGLVWGSQRHPAAAVAADGEVLARYVHAESRLAPSYVRQGGMDLLVVCDHVGSVWLVLDAATGEIVQRLAHDSWGRVQEDTAPGTQPFGFAGGLVDQHSALVHFGARDYDPDTGTWTARDPLGFGGGSSNMYAYTEGDPVNRIDPTGTKVERCRAASGIGWQNAVGLEHHWIRTDTGEAGMGPHPEPTGDGYIEGGETAIVDHTGRGDKKGSVCEEVENVDEECVNQRIGTPNTAPNGTRYGDHTGTYMIHNQCQSTVTDILRSCGTGVDSADDLIDKLTTDPFNPHPFRIDRDSAVHGGMESKAPSPGPQPDHTPADHTPADGSGQDTSASSDGDASSGGQSTEADHTPSDYTPAEGYGEGEGGEAWE